MTGGGSLCHRHVKKYDAATYFVPPDNRNDCSGVDGTICADRKGFLHFIDYYGGGNDHDDKGSNRNYL